MENIKQLSSDYSNLIIGNMASGKTWRTAELIKDTINKGRGAPIEIVRKYIENQGVK